MEKRARDFKNNARDAVDGKKGLAIVAGLIASALGGTASGGFTIPQSGFDFSFPLGGTEGGSSGNPSFDEGFLPAFLIISFILFMIILISSFFIGGVNQSVQIGYSRFNLSLIDRTKPKLSQLFFFFPKYWKACFANLLCGLTVVAGTILFIVPGIILAYSLSMVPYVLAENPELSVTEAIRKSIDLMSGNRWRLFCLEFSFIGWDFLVLITFGIYNIWLVPFKSAAEADFYREISGTRPVWEQPDLITE